MPSVKSEYLKLLYYSNLLRAWSPASGAAYSFKDIAKNETIALHPDSSLKLCRPNAILKSQVVKLSVITYVYVGNMTS